MNDTDTQLIAELVKKVARFEDVTDLTLGVETLKTRYSDDLDFYDLPVWKIKEAIEIAFKDGQDSIMKRGHSVIICGNLDTADKAAILEYIAHQHLKIDTLLSWSKSLDNHSMLQSRMREGLVEAFSRGRESLTRVYADRRLIEQAHMDQIAAITKELLPFKSLANGGDTEVVHDEVNVNDVRKALSAAFDAGVASCEPVDEPIQKPRIRV